MRPFTILATALLVLSSVFPYPVRSETARNPVVPDARLGELRHGTYPSPGIGNWTHAGVDLVAPCGRDIFAFADGKVIDAIYNDRDTNFSTLGHMVLLEHPATLTGKPFYTLYLHMQMPPRVKVGQQVNGGKTILGKVGRTGRAFGCHTHFEIRYFNTRLSNWGNIYGPGDQRGTDYFIQNWDDPITFFERYPIGLTSSEQKPDSGQVSDGVNYLMLLRSGAKWVYTVKQEVTRTASSLGRETKQTRLESGTLTITNEGEKTFEGVNSILFRWIFEFEYGSYSIDYYYAALPEGIALIGMEQNYPSRPTKQVKYDSPVLVLKDPLTVGATWTSTGGSTRSVVGKEGVTTPAGHIEAIKLEQKWQTAQSILTVTEWWGRGVGLVKRTQRGMEVELANYSIPPEAPKVAKGKMSQISEDAETQRSGEGIAAAQTAGDAKIRLKDGSVIVGRIESGTLRVKTTVGELNVSATDIISLKGDDIRLKDGSILKGRILQGETVVRTTRGRLTLRGENVSEVTREIFDVGGTPKGSEARVVKATKPSRDQIANLCVALLKEQFKGSGLMAIPSQLLRVGDTGTVTAVREVSESEIVAKFQVDLTYLVDTSTIDGGLLVIMGFPQGRKGDVIRSEEQCTLIKYDSGWRAENLGGK